MTLTTLLFRLNAVNAAVFAVKSREHHFFWLNAASADNYKLNAVNAVFFRLNAVNDATFPVKRR